MPILTANNITKMYKKKWIIKDINIQILSGKIIGLLGPNGAGKTTIFYTIAGITKCNSGCILIDQQNITNLPLYYRAKLGIGYLPQESSIFQQMSVFNNLMSILEIQKKLNKKQRYERVIQLMDQFKITYLHNHLGYSLSGGERRKVEIARAIAANPKFILLDEPFSGIDPISITEIKGIIEKLRQSGLGIFITDHNVRETLNVCEYAYIVNKGTIIATGTPLEILKNKIVQQTYLGNNFYL
ncbi:LPS export ABC transporter ATP-binding protein [Blochmannia endosymbiont of Camponotus (Colobopsis) obliquus]|uniref:LPS export ABC transporter ATP-binding protein n=1 Tax=Blochmannia endosymbiont of Camponotus (Colobopsis) obliquus TaxID=1505597 RepID=UPI00061A7426|nr:LPS export ABC transporter ATP-binding protein [Blochmannia endosymbiont of Camponotus (Colobopsis) obliquus]AKC60224.1 lipopolysaccharide export system ATP-binding protein LptB [Blochmannia endosymbiont of Camponotus (Colobopsis) obliquus]